MDPQNAADPLLGRPISDASAAGGQQTAADAFLSMLGLLPQQGSGSGAQAPWEPSGSAAAGGCGAAHPWALPGVVSHDTSAVNGQAQMQSRPPGFPALMRNRSNAGGAFGPGPARKQRENLPKQSVSILKKWL